MALLEIALGRFPFALEGDSVNVVVQRIALAPIPSFESELQEQGMPFQELVRSW